MGPPNMNREVRTHVSALQAPKASVENVSRWLMRMYAVHSAMDAVVVPPCAARLG